MKKTHDCPHQKPCISLTWESAEYWKGIKKKENMNALVWKKKGLFILTDNQALCLIGWKSHCLWPQGILVWKRQKRTIAGKTYILNNEGFDQTGLDLSSLFSEAVGFSRASLAGIEIQPYRVEQISRVISKGVSAIYSLAILRSAHLFTQPPLSLSCLQQCCKNTEETRKWNAKTRKWSAFTDAFN